MSELSLKTKCAIFSSQFEPFLPEPRRRSDGTWQIGFGFTHISGKAITENSYGINYEHAMKILEKKLDGFARTIGKLALRDMLELTENHVIALSDFALAHGTRVLTESEIWKSLADKNNDKCKSSMLEFGKVGGIECQSLIERRRQELKLMGID